jgi:multicomponent K+:H+ antiporter subunit G
MLIEALIAFCVLAGAFFTLVGSIGLVRLPDFFARLHGPTKSTTLGVGGILIASSLQFSITEPGLSLHEVLIMLFLFLTAPVSAHLLCKAALHIQVPARPSAPRKRVGERGWSGAPASTGRSGRADTSVPGQ